eukprot:gene27240-biopygen7668
MTNSSHEEDVRDRIELKPKLSIQRSTGWACQENKREGTSQGMGMGKVWEALDEQLRFQLDSGREHLRENSIKNQKTGIGKGRNAITFNSDTSLKSIIDKIRQDIQTEYRFHHNR